MSKAAVLLLFGVLPLPANASDPTQAPPPTLSSAIEAAASLYASLDTHDPYRAIHLSSPAPEMADIYASLDERLPPMQIYSFDAASLNDDVSPSLPSSFAPGSPEDLIIGFIKRFEAGKGGYDAVWARNRTPLPSRPTDMTICKVRDWQLEARKHQASTAIGLFQIVGGTYRSLLDRLQLPCDTPFDSRTQDMLGLALLHGRGWQEFKSGRMSVQDFAYELAGEWAAFPAPYGRNKGFSRYRGIAGNRHQIELGEYMAFLTDLDARIRDGSLPDHTLPSSVDLPEIIFTDTQQAKPKDSTRTVAEVQEVVNFQTH